MATIELQNERWTSQFDTMSRALGGKQALIEVGALPIGNQVAVKWIGLRGITCDRKDDLLPDLDLGDIDHIQHPAAFTSIRTAPRSASIEVVDASRTRHVARLREPPLLPSH